MGRVGLAGTDELADLIETVRRQPSSAPPALRRKTIRLGLILDTQRVAAFVMENPELHRRRHLRHQLGIKDDKTLVRRGGIIAQSGSSTVGNFPQVNGWPSNDS